MATKYAAERGVAEGPTCGKSPISLHFDGKWLEMRTGDYKVSFGAVSGKPSKGDSFDYSKARQKLAGVGPIPEGQYWIDPDDLWENTWYKVGSREAWGNYRITLRVFPMTNTYGRGGFFIHGGTTAGSAGCIDLTTAMDAFVTKMNAYKGTKKCYILVTVKY